jgi:hypothetical protein
MAPVIDSRAIIVMRKVRQACSNKLWSNRLSYHRPTFLAISADLNLSSGDSDINFSRKQRENNNNRAA